MNTMMEYNKQIIDFKNKLNLFPQNIEKMFMSTNNKLAIIAISLLNEEIVKKNISFHGQYLGILAKIIEIPRHFYQSISSNNSLNIEIIFLVFKLFNMNCEAFSNVIDNSEKYLKIYNKAYEQLLKSTCIIFEQKNINSEETIVGEFEHDILEFLSNEILIDKYKNIKFIAKKNNLNLFMKNKIVVACSLILKLSILFSTREYDNQLDQDINLMGEQLGLISKILQDFNNLEDDLKNEIFDNFVVINGIKNTVIIFMNAKTILIEKMISLNICNKTISQIIDLFDDELDKYLNKGKLIDI